MRRRRIAAGLLGAALMVTGTATPANAAGNRVCHSDTNPKAIAIQIAYSGETWSLLHRGDCTTAGRTVMRMRSRAATEAWFFWYGDSSNLRKMAEEPCSVCTQLEGRSVSVRHVRIR